MGIKEESWKDRMNWSLKICLLQIFIYLKTDPDYRDFKAPILITDRNECHKTETVNTLLMGSGKKKRGEDSNSWDIKDFLNLKEWGLGEVWNKSLTKFKMEISTKPW